jgi:flagellar hook capping protein FlgD
MTLLPAAPRLLRRSLFLLALIGLTPLLVATPAKANFHVNEITKVMAGFEGDATVQAIELKMLANNENLVNGKQFKAYDAAGTLVATLGAFTSDLPLANAIAGRNILVATMKWRQRFGLVPDLQINPGIPVMTGQVSHESPDGTCLIDAVGYGNVTTLLAGTTPAPFLPNSGATALVRTVDNAIVPACPMNTDGNKFQQRQGTSAIAILFTNNSGVSVSVFSTATGVDVTPGVAAFRISPNPMRDKVRIQSPGGERVAVYDTRGRLVRTVLGPHSGPVHAEWNGTDDNGRPLPSGVYFARQENAGKSTVRRFVIAR